MSCVQPVIKEPGDLVLDVRDGLHISYSQLTTYVMCPRKFEFQYVRGLAPAFVSVSLPFGSTIHHTLAVLYQSLQIQHQAPSVKELQELFADQWQTVQQQQGDQVRLQGKESWDSLQELGLQMISAYLEHAQKLRMLSGERVVFIELGLRGVLDTMDFIGIIDLLLQDEHNPNHFYIIDHKTATRRYDETKIVTDQQLTAYQWLVHESGYLPAEAELSLCWDVLLKQKTPTVERYTTIRSKQNELTFLTTARTILPAIEHEIFYPNPSWLCRDCGYRHLCDAWL